MKSFQLPSGLAGWVRVVGEVGDPDEYLSSEELATYESHPRESRRAEFLASRVAAKELAVSLGLCALPRDCVIRSVERRPTLVLPGLTSLSVSLSHSAGHGAAVIAGVDVGVDLQEKKEIKPRAKKFFLNDDESELTELFDLVTLWASKEAAWKVVAGRGAQLLRDVRLHPLPGRLEFSSPWGGGRVEVVDLERFVLAVARAE